MTTPPAVRPPTGIPPWSRTGRGILLALGAALISGLAIFLNASAVKQLPDPAVYTTLKNGVAAVILLLAASVAGGIGEARRIPRDRWLALLLVGVVGGSIPFVLFFTGLAQASAPSAAFVQKTLFVWVALLAVPFLGERLGLASLAALAVLLLGQALVLPPAGIVWGMGETLILVATLFWAVETILVKRLLATIPAGFGASMRMGIGLVILMAYLGLSGKASVVAGLLPAQWSWVLLTGTVLAAYVATWFSALQRAPASVVTSVLVLGAVVTAALDVVARGKVPTATTVSGLVLVVAGAALLSAWSIRNAARSAAIASVTATE